MFGTSFERSISYLFGDQSSRGRLSFGVSVYFVQKTHCTVFGFMCNSSPPLIFSHSKTNHSTAKWNHWVSRFLYYTLCIWLRYLIQLKVPTKDLVIFSMIKTWFMDFPTMQKLFERSGQNAIIFFLQTNLTKTNCIAFWVFLSFQRIWAVWQLCYNLSFFRLNLE